MRKIKVGDFIRVRGARDGSFYPARGLWPVTKVGRAIECLAMCGCCKPGTFDEYDIEIGEIKEVVPRAVGSKTVISGGKRSDGYHFAVLRKGKNIKIVAGCRRFSSFKAARSHWTATRGDTRLGTETMDILKKMEAKARANRWIPR